MKADGRAPVLDDEDLPPVVTEPRARRAGRGRIVVAGLLAAAAIGFVLVQGLGGNTVYFRTADEAVAERGDLGDRRFRLQGVVSAGSIDQDAGVLRFAVRGDGGAVVQVAHTGGQPTGLFKDDVPVVLEGRWAQGAERFDSDRVIVKHSETYRTKNPARVDDYAPQGEAS